jgi:hypothetical protein
VGDDSHVAFSQKFLGEKEGWGGALSWCNSQFFVAKFWGEVLAHFQSL